MSDQKKSITPRGILFSGIFLIFMSFCFILGCHYAPAAADASRPGGSSLEIWTAVCSGMSLIGGIACIVAGISLSLEK